MPRPTRMNLTKDGEADPGALYDSQRPYLEQIDLFRTHGGHIDDTRIAQDIMVTRTCLLCGTPFEASAKLRKKKFCSKRCANESARKKTQHAE
jgi:hypothetical protein